MSLFLLGSRLAAAGYAPDYFSYSALTESHGAIVARLVGQLRALAANEEDVGLVGHSFGGLLFREALAYAPRLQVKHLVMLGTPNQPPRLAERIYTHLPFRLLRRGLGLRLASKKWYSSLPALTVPYTIISGTRGWYGRLSPFEFELNDGIVAVSETVLSQSDRPILVPALHTFIMNKRMTYDLIVKKLGPPHSR